MLKIKLFGSLAEKLETDSLWVESSPDLESLKEQLFRLHPNLKNLAFAVALNCQIVEGNPSLQPNDEIALLPPFSGG